MSEWREVVSPRGVRLRYHHDDRGVVVAAPGTPVLRRGLSKCEHDLFAAGLLAGRAERDEEIEGLREALQEIEKAEGPFHRDPLEHSISCIEHMQTVARAALSTDPLPCGHPASAVVSSDEGTSHCGECEERGAQNATPCPHCGQLLDEPYDLWLGCPKCGADSQEGA